MEDLGTTVDGNRSSPVVFLYWCLFMPFEVIWGPFMGFTEDISGDYYRPSRPGPFLHLAGSRAGIPAVRLGYLVCQYCSIPECYNFDP